ncbi:pyruvate dehydrogenase E2 component (dihydrolipoamide acetyltransferase) [Mycetocola sp. CAN_C7]|uniref:dihydrolipoamide acetyltransferase family protein n=1 Tax=Mycetocola sp. CAN_C7 TaxID=2787724 RepID=UPI0018CB328E
MSAKRFALPDLGEGLTESEIVAWKVAVGDTVTLNQIIAEVETAKALVELPSPFAGVVSQLFADEGATVQVGEPIVEFDVDGGDGDTAATPAPVVAADGAADKAPAAPAPAERQAVLVGYGPRIEGGARPIRRVRGWAATASRNGESADTLVPAVAPDRSMAQQTPGLATVDDLRERPRSTPPVRKLARDLGIDLARLQGSGENGLITRDDVQRAVAAESAASVAVGREVSVERLMPGTTREDVRIPVKGVRKATAQAMVRSAFTAPHVTEFLTVDVTAGMDLVRSLATKTEFAGKRLSILTLVAKAVLLAAARTPSVNSHWDDDAQEIVQYGHVNLGIAAATGRGLIVPNIKRADTLTLAELRDALDTLIDEARAGSTSPRSLSGGTITITNVGVFGVDAGTPILNPGEAVILAMGAVRRTPWEYRGEIALREVMTLSLSFDHRLVDGEQGSRFLVDVGTILRDPAMVLTMV